MLNLYTVSQAILPEPRHIGPTALASQYSHLMVEVRRIELLAPCLQSRCSPI